MNLPRVAAPSLLVTLAAPNTACARLDPGPISRPALYPVAIGRS